MYCAGQIGSQLLLQWVARYSEAKKGTFNMTFKPAFGLGIRRRHEDTILDVWFPSLTQSEPDLLAAIQGCFDLSQATTAGNLCHVVHPETYADLATLCEGSSQQDLIAALSKQNLHQGDYAISEVVFFVLTTPDQAVASPEEAYFKLQLLSQRLARPHDLCLDQAFGVLNNIAWTNQGPILPEDLTFERIKALQQGRELVVSHIDKFPYLVNYHAPSGVRVASGSQVRLGAHLAAGTTVMPAGYVNFNAGTLGSAMIEGRVSAGVVVGDNTDIGGGASIMGTLSGGNQHVISIGEDCLLGANAGAGISLGDGCTIAAGLYVYAGMKIALLDAHQQPVNLAGQPVAAGENIVKALELSGRGQLLFLQDSRTGQVTCQPNAKQIELNTSLHQND